MSQRTRPPAGVTAIAALITLAGLGSLAGAFELAVQGRSAVPAILSGLLGVLLLHRAAELWRLHRTAYLITAALLGFRAALALYEVFTNPTPASWFTLGVGALGLVYLLRPEVRQLFQPR